jgi:hypothetical protein
VDYNGDPVPIEYPTNIGLLAGSARVVIRMVTPVADSRRGGAHEVRNAFPCEACGPNREGTSRRYLLVSEASPLISLEVFRLAEASDMVIRDLSASRCEGD